MKKIVLFFMVLAFMTGLSGVAVAEDTLQKVQKRGVLRAGVKDLTPGFALADAKTGDISGYDVDMLRAVARRLGVKMEITPIKEDDRISSLTEGKVDIVAATLTRTKEREKFIDFSYTYFVTAQKFLVRKGTAQRLTDLADKRIGTVAHTTSEKNIRKKLPSATIVLFNDYVPAFLALQNGEIFAISTDEAMLASILAKDGKGVFEITRLSISREPYAFGIRKGQKPFLRAVNRILLEMEKSGEAGKIYDKWFGPESKVPLERTFKITAR